MFLPLAGQSTRLNILTHVSSPAGTVPIENAILYYGKNTWRVRRVTLRTEFKIKQKAMEYVLHKYGQYEIECDDDVGFKIMVRIDVSDNCYRRHVHWLCWLYEAWR